MHGIVTTSTIRLLNGQTNRRLVFANIQLSFLNGGQMLDVDPMLAF